MKMKIILLSFIFFLMSCYDIKGNYDYREMAEIKIENLPETLEILGGIDILLPKSEGLSLKERLRMEILILSFLISWRKRGEVNCMMRHG